MEYPTLAAKLTSLCSSTGLPLSARWLTAQVSEKEGVK